MNEDNIISSYKQVRSELGKYSKELLNKNEIIVLNKIDLIDQYKLDKKVREFNIKIKKKLYYCLLWTKNRFLKSNLV